ncbi:MAG: hypothetical protein WC758_01780 [Candidatus Woesearchaeota archaeon]|jgi:hypothetical protein
MDLVTTTKDLFESYQTFQQIHPHIGTMLTSEFIFLTSDASSQLIKDKKLNFRKLKFTAALAPIYGLCLEGLLETGNLVETYISNNPLIKSALGPNLFGNIYNLFFFANNTIGEKHNYSLTDLTKTYYTAIKDTTTAKEKFTNLIWNNVPKNPYYISVAGTLTFWNAFQTLSYEYLPKELHAPAILGVSLFWTLGLTYASLIGSRKLAKKATHLI